MAEEAVTNGHDDEVFGVENSRPLETIDLRSKPALDGQEQTLAFNSAPTSPSNTENPAPVPTSLEGTELRGRQRSRSGGASFKEWGIHHLKITKQLVQERFGTGVRTVDTDLEKRIEYLRDTQKKYSQLISLANQFQSTFVPMLETQKSLAEHFAFMSVKAPELHFQFHYNAETQKVISRNGETLLAAIKQFVSNMQTVCTKTMEDTLQTVKGYESARLSYDAYRTECDNLRKQAATSQKAASSLTAASAEFEKHKMKFEKLRQDVDIKLKLLDENKLKVAHKQLVLLQAAFAAYMSSNHTAVDAILSEFREKVDEMEESEPPAWLEDLPGHPPAN